MRHFALSAIGLDRPGIVAAVSRSLLDHGLNIEDSQMTILRGHFSMTLVLAGSEGIDFAQLKADLNHTAGELELEAISINEITGAEPAADSNPSHIVTVYGVDHPGIVHAVASALAEARVNITDLNTRLIGDENDLDALYAMLLEVALPAGTNEEALRELLEPVRREQGVDVTVRELEQDAL